MTIREYLSVDHKKCDEAFANMENAIADKKISEAQTLFQDAKTAFLRHFDMEEKVMFLEFEAANAMSCGPTQVMRMEHEQIRAAIDKLDGAIKDKDVSKSLGICETLNFLIQQHNAKEEQILYAMADVALNAQEIIEKMNNV